MVRPLFERLENFMWLRDKVQACVTDDILNVSKKLLRVIPMIW